MSNPFISEADIVLSRDCHLGAPGLRGSVRFQAGQVVHVQDVYYPNMPVIWQQERRWAFWTDSDVDSALIFRADEVAELQIKEEHFSLWVPLLDKLRMEKELPFVVSLIRANGKREKMYDHDHAENDL